MLLQYQYSAMITVNAKFCQKKFKNTLSVEVMQLVQTRRESVSQQLYNNIYLYAE